MKYLASQVGQNHYILPQIKSMNTDVHLWLSNELYESAENDVFRQAYNAAAYPGAKAVHIMPDTHTGFNVPIGSVIVTDNTLILASVGFDISCGILSMKVPGLHAEDVRDFDKRMQWVRAVEHRVAMGLGATQTAGMQQIKRSKLDDVLRYGAKALGVDASLCERQYLRVSEDANPQRIEKAYAKALPQLGSLGSGNHMIEMQVDIEDGSVWAMIHTGSRGYGYLTAEHYFHAAAEARGIQKQHRETAWLYLDEPLGQEYWDHHNMAANYAIANRHVIAQGVSAAFEEVYGMSGKVYYEISHNLVQRETLADGTQGLVHRKGATRAMPAGHPDLVNTKWTEVGHPCLIPGSMLTGAAILLPTEDARRTGFSVNHGSGRLLARGAAKRQLAAEQEAIDTEMCQTSRTFAGVPIEGIVTNSGHTPLDECGKVYKDLDTVLAVLTSNSIAKVIRRLYPVANIKGTD